MTLSMELRGILTDLAVDTGAEGFISETLDVYMPKIMKYITEYIKRNKPVSSYTDAQVELDKYQKNLLKDL